MKVLGFLYKFDALDVIINNTSQLSDVIKAPVSLIDKRDKRLKFPKSKPVLYHFSLQIITLRLIGYFHFGSDHVNNYGRINTGIKLSSRTIGNYFLRF